MKKILSGILVLFLVLSISLIKAPTSVLADMSDEDYCLEFGERCPSVSEPIADGWQGNSSFNLISSSRLPPPPRLDLEVVAGGIVVEAQGTFSIQTRGAAYGWEYIVARLNMEPGTVEQVSGGTFTSGRWARIHSTTEHFPDEEGPYITSFFANTPGIYTIFGMYTGE